MPDCITLAAPMPWSLLNLCHPRSMFRLTPVAKPFWSRGWSDMLPLLSPPLGGRNWTSNSCSLFLDARLVAPHCLSSSVFWRFRVRRLWSSLCCHSLACVRLVAACCKAVYLPDTCCENDPILSCGDQPVRYALDPAVCSSREHYFEN